MISINIISDLVVFLSVTAILVPLAHRARINPVLTYLVIGIVVGPHGLGAFTETYPILRYVTITEDEATNLLAELGVVFLLFMVGLELSFQQLWALRKYVLGLGGAQVMVSAAVIGGIAAAFGNPMQASILLGLSFSLSSTAIVMQLFSQTHGLATPQGRIGFSILLFQDLMIVPLLFLTSAFAHGDDQNLWLALVLTIAKAALTVLAVLGAGRALIRPLFNIATFGRSPEFFMAATLLLVIGTAFLTHEAGLSMALGAFLSGLLLSESEFRHQVETDIAPFKGLLLGVFFVSVGMQVDLRLVVQEAPLLIMSVAGLFLIKASILLALGILFGLSLAVAAEIAILLAHGGEFAFVVVGLALQLGLLPRETGDFMIMTVALSMLFVPALASAAPRLAQRFGRTFGVGSVLDLAEIDEARSGHVVIAGLGRVGQVLARVLENERIPYVAIDDTVSVVADNRLQGRHVRFGDAGNPGVLERAGVARARALVLTIDNPVVAQRAVQAVAAHWPQIPVIARVRDALHARTLLEMGASEVVPETVEASLQLSGRVLSSLGIDGDHINERIALERAHEQGRLALRQT
ncbi:MAG: cation:proton antiporter [Alphaproteobacteria bacterium]|nr:cation:proton antiporter [Alphaproteobacteria bacterium]